MIVQQYAYSAAAMQIQLPSIAIIIIITYYKDKINVMYIY